MLYQLHPPCSEKISPLKFLVLNFISTVCTLKSTIHNNMSKCENNVQKNKVDMIENHDLQS